MTQDELIQQFQEWMQHAAGADLSKEEYIDLLREALGDIEDAITAAEDDEKFE